MKKLTLASIALAALTTASTALAGDRIHLEMNVHAQNIYAREGASSFAMRHSSSTLSGRISATINGRSASQEIPATSQSSEAASGRIDVLSANSIRISGADGQSVVVKARVSADGSIYASGRHLGRAMRAMVAPQLAAIQQQFAGQVSARLDVRARDLICAPKADGLACSMGATIVLSASQN
jgi:hypothetical protein